MCAKSVDDLVFDDDWSDLTRIRDKPQINSARMYEYRRERLREQGDDVALTQLDEALAPFTYEAGQDQEATPRYLRAGKDLVAKLTGTAFGPAE